jgi:hypothetical protein
MALSKSLRFEILRRDSHVCRYCGAKAPDAQLVVDHVVPVSLGGADDPANLVTACEDCNAGKGSTPPDAALISDVKQSQEKYELALALAGLKIEIERQEIQGLVAEFHDAWCNAMPSFAQPGRGDFPGPEKLGQTLKTFLSRGLGWEAIIDCVQIAADASHVAQRSRFRYFCGVCNVKVREIHETAVQIAREQL